MAGIGEFRGLWELRGASSLSLRDMVGGGLPGGGDSVT